MELDMEWPAMELDTELDMHLAWSKKPRQLQFQDQAHILQEAILRDPTLKAPILKVTTLKVPVQQDMALKVPAQQGMVQDMAQGMAQVTEQQVMDQQVTVEPQAVLQIINNLKVWATSNLIDSFIGV